MSAGAGQGSQQFLGRVYLSTRQVVVLRYDASVKFTVIMVVWLAAILAKRNVTIMIKDAQGIRR